MRVSVLILVVVGLFKLEAAIPAPDPIAVGPFPMVRPFEGRFRFGWSNIEAASADARLTLREGTARVNVNGGTTGLARTLWRLDARNEADFRIEGLVPIGFRQLEIYASKRISTVTEFQTDRLRRLRVRTPDGGPSKWKTMHVPAVRDIVTAMFFIRSQRLKDGDTLRINAFPGDSPFQVEVKVLGRRSLALNGRHQPAILLDFQLQRIQLEKGRPIGLEPHGKFRSGKVWLSDDQHRIPLRAEVNIFIGYIFGELADVKFTDSGEAGTM